MTVRRLRFPLAIGLVVAACTSLPSASLSPTSSSGQPAITPSATAVVTPVTSAVSTPVASASNSVQWREPASYTFTLESTCGERALIGTFNVEVQDGETVGVEAISGYFVSHPAALPTSLVPTLDDILAEAADARSRDADEVSVVLDPIDGHPVRVSIDWKTNTIDDEACYEITNYSPAPSV
jgi:hypothetical protein